MGGDAAAEGPPVVYVALGSHANYFAPGVHQVELVPPREVIAGFQQAGLPLPADVAAAGPAAEARGPRPARDGGRRAGRARPAGLDPLPGVWGELEYWGAPLHVRHGPGGIVARRAGVPRGLAAPARDARELARRPSLLRLSYPGPGVTGAGARARPAVARHRVEVARHVGGQLGGVCAGAVDEGRLAPARTACP